MSRYHKVRAFNWADFADRCGIDRRLLVREIKRMIKVLRSQLPMLMGQPDYTEEVQATIQAITNLVLKQAEQLESDAVMITKVALD